jgi:hypothetical protein
LRVDTSRVVRRPRALFVCFIISSPDFHRARRRTAEVTPSNPRRQDRFAAVIAIPVVGDCADFG